MPSSTKVVGPAVARPYLWFGLNKWEGQVTREDNSQYRFISDNALGASEKFGVKSVSILAVKP